MSVMETDGRSGRCAFRQWHGPRPTGVGLQFDEYLDDSSDLGPSKPVSWPTLRHSNHDYENDCPLDEKVVGRPLPQPSSYSHL
jgi:hypothetical protein